MKPTILILWALALSSGATAQTLNKQTLCKKWRLEKYVIFWMSHEPETNEQQDYIELRPNMTYTSVDAGKLSEGRWGYNDEQNHFTLYSGGEQGGLKFWVKKLTPARLVVEVDLTEMDGVDIHFVTKKP